MLRAATFVLALAPFLVLSPCGSARGESVQAVKNSRWDTRYEAANGARIRAIVHFSGSSGTYDILNSSGSRSETGRLSNIKYFPSSNSKVLVTGNWSLRNFDGAFQFEVSSDGRAIHGAWNDVDRGTGGKWSGSRK